MKKHQSILLFIERLENAIAPVKPETVDYWDGDLCAIGLKNSNKLVYISCYNYLNEPVIKFDYEIELTDRSEAAGYKVLKRREAVSEQELIDSIRANLL